jgi:GNAT superfamily N-acetyltransferase
VNVYYVAEVASVIRRAGAVPGEVAVRPAGETDIPELARLYLRAYDPPAVRTLDEAVAEMTSSLDGTWGEPWPAASPAAWIGGDLAAAVQLVRRPAPQAMPGAPDCPWLIEVFTDPEHRRRGLARGLLSVACGELAAAGEPQVGLTVSTGNAAALALYTSLDFRPVP